MVSFLNKNTYEQKSIKKTLIKVFGLGNSLSQKICNRLGFNSFFNFSKLSNKQIAYLSNNIVKNRKFLKQEELSRYISENIKLLARIKSYRGLRHRFALPLRGQRTKTNGKTAKRRNSIL